MKQFLKICLVTIRSANACKISGRLIRDDQNNMDKQDANTRAMSASITRQQFHSKICPSSEKLNSERTQSVEDLESKTMHSTETTSIASKCLPKKSNEHVLETLRKQKSFTNIKENLANEKLAADKLNLIKDKIQPKSSMNITDYTNFPQDEKTPSFTKHDDLKQIPQNLSQRKVKSAKPLKTEKISYTESGRLPQPKISEKSSKQKHFFPSCIQYTFLRLIAFFLLFCAWIIVYAFPCLQFTYHIPVIKTELIESVAENIPMTKTCKLMPQWWSDQKAFVRNIVEKTHYFQALNLSMNQTNQRLEIFEDENIIQKLKPFNGQIFVVFGCFVLAFPILLLLMFLRCRSEREDLMEEAMFDLVEISICSVFSVIEFYMSSGTEIRAVMDSMCAMYLEQQSIQINRFMKEKVYNICTDVKIEAYGFLSSGFIFLFLVFLFAIDLIILLKNAEEVESRKYLKMAACLHYDKTLKCMSKSVMEDVFTDYTSNRKQTKQKTKPDIRKR